MSCEGHSHDHEHAESDDTSTALGTSLRPSIEFASVTCLNESIPGAGKSILKLYEDRFTANPSLVSQDDPDEDPELLLTVPFSEAVAIKSVSVMSYANSPASQSHRNAAPRTLKIFVNRQNLDFETVRDLEPAAKISLVPPLHQWDSNHAGGTIDYPLRPAGRFQNVTEIALYFCDNYAMPDGDLEDYDGDRVPTEITYIGFKGKGTNVKRKAVEAVYETTGMKKDHKVPGAEYFGREGV